MSLINKDAFNKSLAKLEQMTVNKAQLFHTSGDSQPGSWAGSNQENTVDGQADDIVDENGTDYGAVKKALAGKVAKGVKLTDAEVAISKGQNPLKLISDKIAKGQRLSNVEAWALKGGMGMFGAAKPPVMKATSEDIQDPETEAKEGDSGEARSASRIDKSLETAVKNNEELKKSIKMSPFLLEFTKAMGSALEGTGDKVTEVVKAVTTLAAKVEHLEKAMGANWKLQGDFNKSLGEAVVGLGQAASASADVANQAATGPARGPLSVVKGGRQGGVVEKSFGGQDQGLGALEKSQLTGVLLDLHKSGHVTESDVIKYESTGQVSDQVIAKAKAYLAGAR